MQHFLPKRSSSAAAPSHPKPVPTQHPVKPAPPAACTVSKPKTRQSSHSTRRYPFPKHQDPWPKVALDPVPQVSSWSVGQEEEGEISRCSWTCRQLVLFSGPERCLLSHPDSPLSQIILEICLRGCGLSIYRPSLRAVPDSSHFYEVHGCSSFPSEADGNSHSELPRWLACFSPVRGWATICQIPPPQPLGMPGTQGQFCQELAAPQPMDSVPGSSSWLSLNEGSSSARTCTGHTAACGLLQNWSLSPSQDVSEDAGPHGATAGPLGKTLSGSSGCDSGNGLQKEGCFDRCVQHRLGSSVRGQTNSRPLVKRGKSVTHRLPGNAGSVSSPFLPSCQT